MVCESHIEDDFLLFLEELNYRLRPDISDLGSLEKNFREKFNALNACTLTDSEFERLLPEIVSPDVFLTAERLRRKETFIRDDDTELHYQLVNLTDWCKNTFEVVSQLRINTRSSHQRYDVIILINGLPCVQIELKTLDVSPRRAMQQILDYKKDPGNGYTNTLLCFMQLFIVSNRDRTYYFANNNNQHFAFNADERFLPVYTWADRENEKIHSLSDFARTFLPKCTLGETISRYMVLVASEQKLLMMRPYQIYAVKEIVSCIEQNCGNGFIWHTTGSGKTLTSFKASTLLRDNPNIEKCLFVVDRKDLDRQTREEFNKFQADCVEENTNTHTLVRRLLSTHKSDKVIVTTIQKLGLALDGTHKAKYREQLAELSQKRLVFIFDECHRSQFGENHRAIKEFFPNSQLFGFTGTPIFEKNATTRQITDEVATLKTTQDVFEKELHAYTITHAIEDKNVLKFHIDYFKPEGEKLPKPGEPLAKQAVIEAILDRHNQVTAERKFNALFATASINDAIEYYQLFHTLQQERQDADSSFQPLRLACVFSPPAQGDQDVKQLQEDLPQEQADNKIDPDGEKKALEGIIADYNANFGTNHRITEFDAYYQDVQSRIKDQRLPNSEIPAAQKVDLVIVVDMLLTGFDSKYLNTLYVDKNLKYHGLIQALSRTNRVLNDTKPHGHILDFRQQEESVDEAITLFSGQYEESPREIWLVDPAPKVIEKLDEAVAQFEGFMQAHGLTTSASDIPKLKGDQARAEFIKNFKEIRRLKTQLDQYTDLQPEQRETIASLLPTDQQRSLQSAYVDTALELKKERERKDPAEVAPEVENLDFEFVLFSSATIDYDYIMSLLANFSQEGPGKQSMTREQLIELITADAKFADQRELITAYIRTLQPGGGLTKEEILAGYETFRSEKNDREIDQLAEKHELSPESLHAFVDEILRRYVFDGEDLTDLLAPLDLGWKDRRVRELALMDDLVPVLNQRAGDRKIAGLEGYEG